jgi:branched-subunit amino acid permease
MFAQQTLSHFGESAKYETTASNGYFLKASIYIITAIMLIAPFGLTVVSESAVPIGLLVFYPLTIFACMQWSKKNLSIHQRIFSKVVSIVTIFMIYKIAEYISIHSFQLITVPLALTFPILLASLALFNTNKSSSSRIG